MNHSRKRSEKIRSTKYQNIWIIIFSRYKICGTWQICESLKKRIDSRIESFFWNIEKKKKGNGDYNFFLYKYLNWRNDSIMEMKRDRNFKQIIGRSDLGFILNDRAPRNT